jgi:hypothetical protein
VRRAEVEVYPLWFAIGPEGPFGGTSRLIVKVEPNSERELRVGFYEEEVAGSGPMWRASGWMASIMSAFALGVDPAEYRYTFDIEGRIDGPSAGGLMTAAVLAALLGDEVKEDVAMTGTINPDGTIGPVGGIPQKIEGAVKAGKKLVLVPIGLRYSFDMAKQEWIDVVEHGRKLGAEVKEVSDIYQAYELLTGEELPKPEGAKDMRPELPPGAFDRVRAKAREWYARYTKIRAEYEAIKGLFKLALEEVMAMADECAQESDSYFKQGMMMSAYGEALEATSYATVAYELAKLNEVYSLSGIEAAINHVRAKSVVETKITALLERFRVEKLRTLSDLIALSDAYGNLITAMGLSDMAASILAREVGTEEELLMNLYLAALFYSLTDHVVEVSEDSTEIGMGFGTFPLPGEEEIARTADVLRRASEANINYFETVIVDEMAEKLGVHPKELKEAFVGQEFDYTFALSCLNALPTIEEKFRPGPEANYAKLGGSLTSYSFSSILIAKYYSLGAEVDETGQIVGVQYEKALIELFDFIERRARENIAQASSLGCEPVMPVLYYEFAKGLREGDMADKFRAINFFWLASTQAQILSILSGGAKLVP